MSDSRFKDRHYEDALQYAKDVLSSSSSIDELLLNTNIEKENKDILEKENK